MHAATSSSHLILPSPQRVTRIQRPRLELASKSKSTTHDRRQSSNGFGGRAASSTHTGKHPEAILPSTERNHLMAFASAALTAVSRAISGRDLLSFELRDLVLDEPINLAKKPRPKDRGVLFAKPRNTRGGVGRPTSSVIEPVPKEQPHVIAGRLLRMHRRSEDLLGDEELGVRVQPFMKRDRVLGSESRDDRPSSGKHPAIELGHARRQKARRVPPRSRRSPIAPSDPPPPLTLTLTQQLVIRAQKIDRMCRDDVRG